MKILFEADTNAILELACTVRTGLCLLRKNSVFSRSFQKTVPVEVLKEINVNVYAEYQELACFLGNFHLLPELPKYLFVDLNIVKKKEIVQTVALLCSLHQFSSTNIICVLNTYMLNDKTWNLFSRYFSEIFQVQHTNLFQFLGESGEFSLVLIGELSSNFSKILIF